MKALLRTSFFAFTASLVLVACTGSGGTPGASAHEAGSPTTETTTSPGAPAGIPPDVWLAILTDLHNRLGADVLDPTVVTAVAETWTDGSLGCPLPGELYTQALVDGYQVVLEIAGERYDYRVGNGTDVRLCEQ